MGPYYQDLKGQPVPKKAKPDEELMHPRRHAVHKLVGALKADEAKRARAKPQEQGPDGLGDAAKMDQMDPAYAQENTKAIGKGGPGKAAAFEAGADSEPDPLDPNEQAEGEHEGLSGHHVKLGLEHVHALKSILEKK